MNEQDKLFLEIMNLPDTTEEEHIDKFIKIHEYSIKYEGLDNSGYWVEDKDFVKQYQFDKLAKIAKERGYVYCDRKDSNDPENPSEDYIFYKIKD